MLDIVHHIPAEAVRPLLEQVAKALPAGRPAPREGRGQPPGMEALVHPRARPRDGSAHAGALLAGGALAGLLRDVGFRVHRHLMVDFLPYPHVLYIVRAPAVISDRSCAEG